MTLPGFVVILLALVAIGLIIFFVYIFSKGKSKADEEISPEEEIADDLVYDSETGKYVTVEELVEKHQLDYLDEAKVEKVYTNLPEEMKQEVNFREVEIILENLYQLKTLDPESLNREGDFFPDLMQKEMEKKGKNVRKETILKVIELYEGLGSPAD